MLESFFRLATLLAIFASVFIVSQLVLAITWRNRERFAAVNKRLRMIKEGTNRGDVIATLRKNAPRDFAHLPRIVAAPLQAMQRAMLAAAVPFTLSHLLLGMGGGFLAVLAVILLGAGSAGLAGSPGVVLLAVVLAGAIAVGLPLLLISHRAQRRRKRMEQQFPVALDIFVRALRAGHPIAAAIELLTQEMDDPIGSEFGLVADEVSYGADLTDAIDAMADRWDLEDIRMFVVSLSVQLETGGNLAEILENLSGVIRARASLYLKVRALSSEGRMTGWILSVLPIFTMVSMFLINPGFYLNVAKDPIFLFGFPGLLLLYVTGFIWIRKLVDIKV
ncbi:MAG: type II secretion system F family protein [Pseudomonadota bacterium]